MIDLTRRGLLGGLLAAPAIVRFASIMPVKVLPPELVLFNPANLEFTNGPLTLETITREMLRLTKNAMDLNGIESKLSPILTPTLLVNREQKQKYVEFILSFADRKLPLSIFSDRVLAPRARNLAKDIQNSVYKRLKVGAITSCVLKMPPPQQVDEAASITGHGLNMRGLTHFSILEDSTICRFDILYTEKTVANLDSIPKLATPKGKLP